MRRLSMRLLILTLAFLVAPRAEAGFAVTTQAVLQTFCSDRDAGRHPKRTQLTQFVTSDTFAGPGETALLLVYESTSGSLRAGSVRAQVTLERPDSAAESLGSLKARVDRAQGGGQAIRVIDGELDLGSSIVWNLRFTRLGKLERDACLRVIAGAAAE